MKTHSFLAFDLGATSGRAVLLSVSGDSVQMEEIHRFPNAMIHVQGKYYWDIYALFEEIKQGLRICAQKGVSPDSMGIDTWGVDFGCVAPDGVLLGLPRAYRDPFTDGAEKAVFNRINARDLYAKTGIQTMNFNTIFQLYQSRKEHFSPLMSAEKILFIPDLLAYMLTGKQVCEYTIASTSQLLDAVKKQFSPACFEAIDVPMSLTCDMVMPGTTVGMLSEDVARETGIGQLPLIAVAGHDTASAVAAVPTADERFAYLSSGTWSLMGIETKAPILTEEAYRENFTNEGGVDGTVRFLKNITGMWLLEQCRKEWAGKGRHYTYPEIMQMAQRRSDFSALFCPDDPSLANPESMPDAIAQLCRQAGEAVPETDEEFVSCIFHSLANRYGEVFEMLVKISPFPIERLHIIGGGAQNALLNQLTADRIGLPVVAGPSEATAIGNGMIQAQAAGVVKDRWEYRRLISRFSSLQVFEPKKKI